MMDNVFAYPDVATTMIRRISTNRESAIKDLELSRIMA